MVSVTSARSGAIHSSGHNRNAGRDNSSCLAKVVLPEPGNPQIKKRVAIVVQVYFRDAPYGNLAASSVILLTELKHIIDIIGNKIRTPSRRSISSDLSTER